jgi:hypothetical protein
MLRLLAKLAVNFAVTHRELSLHSVQGRGAA